MSEQKILAIDPGESVGWAVGVIYEGDLAVVNHGIHSLRDFAIKLGESFKNYDLVLYETWRLYPHMARTMVGSDMQSSQLVGIIRYLSWLNPQVKLVSQGASLKKTGEKVAPPTVQEILDRLPKSHDDAHDGDALLHLAAYWHKSRIGGNVTV